MNGLEIQGFVPFFNFNLAIVFSSFESSGFSTDTNLFKGHRYAFEDRL